jgi:biopolymer transport protein ExbD
MKLESHLPRQSPWLYIAPLLTAILLLLIYFLLSSGFIAQSGVSIRLPESPARLAGFELAHVITLAPGEPVRIFFNGNPVTRQELTQNLATHQQGGRRALIHADRRVPFGQVMEISQLTLDQHYDVAYATTLPPSRSTAP